MQGTSSVVAAASDSPEFRAAAAEASEAAAREQGAACVLDSNASLCVRQPGDPTLGLYRIAVVPWVFISFGLLLFLFGVVLAILILTPWVDANVRSVTAAVAAILIGPVILVWAGASDATRNRTLARRLGARKGELEARAAAVYPFAVEDPATYQKQKVISEDYALGGLDRTRPGLLLDGMRYRYVIRPQDVTAVREDKDYLIVSYAVRGVPVTLALTLLLGEKEEERRVLAAVREALSRGQRGHAAGRTPS